MKLTKRQLQRIIQEEFDAILSEEIPKMGSLGATSAMKQKSAGALKAALPGTQGRTAGKATPMKSFQPAATARLKQMRKGTQFQQFDKRPEFEPLEGIDEEEELEENDLHDLVQEVYRRLLRGK